VVAGQTWAENPRIVLNPAWASFVRLWAACRAGMGGIACWPDAGGVGDQAAWQPMLSTQMTPFFPNEGLSSA